MPRHKRTWLRPSEPSPLARATSINVAGSTSIPAALPSFNFIERKAPSRPPPTTAATVLPSLAATTKRNHSPPTGTPNNGHAPVSAIDMDAIVFHTLKRFAQELDEPALTEESKMARLWQSLQRHSEAGRFRSLTEYSPNRICAVLAIEMLQQILQATGVSLILTNLLVGAIGNSIFLGYAPNKPAHELTQYADMAHDLHDQLRATTDDLAACKKQAQLAAFQLEEQSDSSSDDKARLVTAVYRSVEEQGLAPSLITETLTPFFNDELLLLLWNAMAKVSATQSLSVELGSSDSDGVVTSFTSNRRRASIMTTKVLKERVRLMLLLWQTLSAEEKDVVSTCLASGSASSSSSSADARASGSSGVALKGVLQTLEEMYVSEQVRDRSSPRRSMFLSPMARHSSVVFRPPLGHNSSGGGSGPGAGGSVASPGGRHDAMTFTRAKSRQRLMSTRFAIPSTSVQDETIVPPPPNVSIPDVLLGALAESQHEAATEEAQLLIEQLSNDQDEILRQCEDIFDLLCEDPAEIPVRHGVPKHQLEATGNDTSAQAIVDRAKERLCELLCSYVDAPSFIVDKIAKSEADRELRESVSRDLEDANSTTAVVQMLIQRQRQNPQMLVHAIAQSPEILLSAITHNNGILRFAMTKFSPLVKRFLRLDLKACEYLDALAQQNKGVQLLWGTNPSTGTTASASPPSERGTGLGSVGDGLEELMVSSMVDMSTSGGSRAAVLTPSEGYLLEWFTAHMEELALLSLKRPDLLKPLFVEMHTVADVGTFHKVMVQLASTKGVQNFLQRSSVATLEKIAQEDPAEVARLLRDIFTDDGNQDLLHQLRASPYLTTCLSECHPTAIQDVITSDMDMWRHYFVETVAASDTMIKEVLVTRTEQLDGSDTLVLLFSAVVANATAGLNLHALDFGASPADVAFAKKRDGSSRRKRAQCVYLRGGSSVFRALISPLIATIGFHPHAHNVVSSSSSSSSSPWVSRSVFPHGGRTSTSSSTSSSNAAARGKGASKKTHRGSSGQSPAKKKSPPPQLSTTKKDELSAAIETSKTALVDLPTGRDTPPCAASDTTMLASSSSSSYTSPATRLVETMPAMWRSFALVFVRHQQQQQPSHDDDAAAPHDVRFRAPTLARAQAKTLILDLWIEFLKVDAAQLDNACLYSLAPFVCDYLVTRYDAPSVVGAWLVALTEAMAAFPDDSRIAFFAAACGVHTSRAMTTDVDLIGDGYDTFLYYAHALGHVLFGGMKVFKPECRLEETVDGSCSVEKQLVITTAVRLFDHRLLSGTEMDALMTRLDALPVTSSLSSSTKTVELDDAMDVFLDQWRLVNRHVDDRYRQAFAFHDTAGSNRIGLEQFIRIVTSVTQQGVSPRECLLVFCDVGLELLDLDTLLRVTRVYHLRPFHVHLPEIPLDESDLLELTASLGRTNIFSMAREVEDLHRFWKGLRVDVQAQLDALHQSKQTKMHLKKQSALIEKLLHDLQATPSTPQPPSSASSNNRPRSHQQPQRLVAAATTTTTGPQMLHKTWTELRACAKMLQSAKLTQHYLSRLYIQTCVVRWIRQARKRRLARELSDATAIGTDQANGSSE